MGPRPDGRGKAAERAGQDLCAIYASMGPRPDGRGKRLERGSARGQAHQRQWGRGQTAAERG